MRCVKHYQSLFQRELTTSKLAKPIYARKRYFARAFTLLEFIMVLAIASIMVSLVAPSFEKLIAANQANTLQSALRSAIYSARTAAISEIKTSVLCPYNPSGCGSNWRNGAMIMTDENNNRIIDNNDTLLESINLRDGQFELRWKASAGRNFLRFSPTGMAKEFGRFHLCHESNDLTLARSIAINRQGRLRVYRDKNHDGIVEDIDGRLPDCK